MNFKIEKNIPIPPKKGSSFKYPWKEKAVITQILRYLKKIIKLTYFNMETIHYSVDGNQAVSLTTIINENPDLTKEEIESIKSLKDGESVFLGQSTEIKAIIIINESPDDHINKAEAEHYQFIDDNYEENGDPKDFFYDDPY